MKTIELPVVPDSADLSSAIDILRKTDRSAILAELGGQR
jgi:hypothetical protein